MSVVGLAVAAAAAAPGCPAPVVETHDNPFLPRGFESGSRWIAPKRKRLYAVMWAGRAVDGRFSVYAGGRNPQTGIAEKIMWVVPARATGLAATGMGLEWRRNGKSFVQRREGRPGRMSFKRCPEPLFYPSILEPPEPGCWKLRVRTGRVRVTLYVIVEAPPSR